MITKCDIDSKWVSSIFIQLYKSIYSWKMDDKDITNVTKLFKEMVQYLLDLSINNCPQYDYIFIRGREAEDFNDRKSWNGKQIRKLLLIVIVADLDRFTTKSKLITYIRVFVKLYN